MEAATQKPTDNPAVRQLSMISMFSITNKNARKINKIAATNGNNNMVLAFYDIFSHFYC